MSKLMFIEDYNNYFNKIVKVDTVFTGFTTEEKNNTNFNPNDDVDTEHVINWDKSWMPDYMVILGTNDTVESRWFVTEHIRLRGNQYKFVLRRDLLADKYDIVVNAPIALQKGMVKSTNNLIFNKEGFNVNQILTSQQLLKDSKNSFPWIYLYCAKNAGDIEAAVQADFTTDPDIVIQTTIDNSIYAGGTHTEHAKNIYFASKLRFTVDYQGQLYRKYEFNSSVSNMIAPSTYYDQYVDLGNTHYTESDVKTNLDTNVKPNYNTYKNTFIASEPNTYLTEQEANQLNNADGKLLRDINGNYYTLSVTSNETTETEDFQQSDAISQAIFNQIKVPYPDATMTSTPISITYRKRVFTVIASPATDIDYTVSIAQSTHHTTNDSECNIIAIPYADVYVNTTGSSTPEFMVTRESQLAMARALAQKATSAKIYDMQLLPYSPFYEDCEDNYIDISTMNSELYQIQTYNGNAKNILFYVTYANFNNTIAKSVSVPTHSEAGGDVDVNFKLVNECDMWRLCSPNFNGVFEFNVAKNRGITEFDVDVTLRPYNPYIHVNPVFKALYGDEFDDPRGLICGGDFSLPITGDAFTQYELNNKNYQIAFDRQITNLEFNQRQEKTMATVQAIVGTAQGMATGAAGGSFIGKTGSTVAGAIIGGATSLAGGIADLAMLDDRQKEQKAYAIDNFNYQLGNIKALPYSLNKVNPLTMNNKIFPVLEYYTCTSEERTALVNKILYTGMTLNVIGTIANFKTNYGSASKHFYKGAIIRLENLGLASHEAYEIYKEIEEGVYI